MIHLRIQLLAEDIRDMMKKGSRGTTRLGTENMGSFSLGTIIVFFELLKSSSPPFISYCKRKSTQVGNVLELHKQILKFPRLM